MPSTPHVQVRISEQFNDVLVHIQLTCNFFKMLICLVFSFWRW
ncbi:hypothetical protein LEMLEM_LOCUS12313, partial [Lemmus lemmus]